MLKVIALAACVIGFIFLGPKAVAEFRRANPRTRIPSSDSPERTDAGDKPESGVAA